MDAEKRRKLIALLGMLGSAHDGEKLNAARLAQRTLGEMGLTWEEFCGAQPNSKGDSTAYMNGYNDGYRTGLAKGHASAVVKKPMTWVAFCRDLQQNYYDNLNDWEQGFVDNYVSRGWSEPTPKQRSVFERIASKCDVELPE